jgi:hypothetical protein
MAVVNRMGHPRMALPTFVNFPASHAYREGGPRLIWDTWFATVGGAQCQ